MRKSVLLYALISIGLFCSASFASAQTSAAAELQALVKQLQEQIKTLQVQVQELKSQLAVTKEESVVIKQEVAATKQEVAEVKQELQLTRALQRGTRGDDVRKLQEFLSQFPDVYPVGLITGFYGPATEAAVRKLQAKHGIEQVGIIGPKTLQKINELISEGAGESEKIPPGLLRAPGIQKKLGTSTILDTLPPILEATTTSPVIAATTTSAIPAEPVGQTGTTTAPATPAFPSAPAATNTTTATSATTSTATTTGAAAPPIFKITTPNGGEQWTAGSGYTITWTSAGASVATVSIDLYKSGGYQASIAYDVSNTGSVNWMVPGTIATGGDYKIRVYSNMYYNNFDESDGALSIIVPVTAPSAPPISYWKFNGSGANEIAGGPSAVAVGSAAFRESGGKFGGYLYIPSSGDYAKIPYRSMFDLQNFTVEFWFRQRANQSFNQNLIYKGTPVNNYNFNIFRNLWNQFNNGAVIAGSTAAGTGYWHQVSNNNEPPHNAWHHVVYTKTTEGAAYYIDGVVIHSRNYAADKSPEYAGPVKTPATDIIIGSPAPDTDMDNLRIYNYALSRGEVLYNWGSNPDSAPPPADTAPPTISNIQATNITATSVVIIWTTDEAADSRVEYGLTSAYDPGLNVNSDSLVTNHSIAFLTVLYPNTIYHYRVKSKDATGNLATSADQTFTTIAAPVAAKLPAPTNIRGDWFYGWWDIRDNKMGQNILFQYPADSSVKAAKFRFYEKRPADSSFSLGAEFSGFDTTSCATNATAIYAGTWYLKGPPWGSCQNWFIYRNSMSASSYLVGEYNYYVAAVDTAGNEGGPSPTVKFVFLQPDVITSPTASQTTSLTPTFQWTRGSAWPSDFKASAILFDSPTAINPIWVPLATTDTSKTYDGPALDPAKQYRVSVYGRSASPSQYTDSLALPSATIDFRVSTSTAAAAAPSNLASTLASLSQILYQLKQLLSP